MDNIGEIIKKILHKKGLLEVVKQQEVLIKWAEMVGEKIAARTKAVKINKGVLWVKVSDSVWTHHLAMLKPKILTRMGDSFEKETVKDIYFFVGEVEGNDTVSPERREDRKRPYLQDFSREEIEEILELIPNQQQEIKQKIKIILEKGSKGR
ncbi:MAG: DUF721 domain-containing protein [Firmicutes bacterium]|nr:DUF721 domain-containing protein [Bacillota bacterium]